MSLELSPEGGWLNTQQPLRLGVELAGSVVLVWFFCASSSAAVESLDDVRALARRFEPEGLRIVGVYTPQYRAEARKRHVFNAVDRLEISFPVAVDSKQAMFRAFDARSWPTFVLIDRTGTCAARIAGAGNRELLQRCIGDLIGTPGQDQTDDQLVGPHATLHRSAGALRFPSAVCAQTPAVGRDGRVFIADSGHRRVIDAGWPDHNGQTHMRAIHTGFNQPRGLAFDAEHEQLFIADAGNHTISRIDTRTGNLTTVIGTGERGFDRRGGATGTNQPLNAPTDLLLDRARSRLFIVMSGLNQIWSADLNTMVARAFAGTGEMKIADGSLDRAAFWQPRSLAAHHDFRSIFCLDADGSALREIQLAPREVRTLIGTPEGYTGDSDGPFAHARLCHPTGMTMIPTDAGPRLVIADSYNCMLRVADPAAGTIEKFARDLWLFEPAGVHWAGALASKTEQPRLFICDTGNHRLVQSDPLGATWQELRIGGLSCEGPQALATPPAAFTPERAAFNVPLHAPCTMSIGLPASSQARHSQDLPVCVRASVIEGPLAGRTLFQSTRPPGSRSLPFEVNIPPDVVEVRTVLLVELSLGLDSAGASFATPFYKSWRVRFGSDGGEPRLIAEA